MSARTDNRLIIGGQPRADLMPPEINREKVLRGQRRGLVTIVVLSLVLVLALYAVTAGLSSTSQANLQAEKNKTALIIAEEGKYAAAKSLTVQVDAAKSARIQATYLEIDWESYYSALGATIPSGARIKSILAKVPDARPPGPVIADKSTIVATLKILINVQSPEDIPNWFDTVDSMTGFIDATPESFAFNKDEGGWDTTVTLHVDAAALEDRYSAKATN